MEFVVKGEEYSWWEKPFLGKEPWIWWLAIAIFVVLCIFALIFLAWCSISDWKDNSVAKPNKEKEIVDAKEKHLQGRMDSREAMTNQIPKKDKRAFMN